MPDILCSADLTSEDYIMVLSISSLLGISPEEVIRMAVRKFSSACVPTHSEKKTRTA